MLTTNVDSYRVLGYVRRPAGWSRGTFGTATTAGRAEVSGFVNHDRTFAVHDVHDGNTATWRVTHLGTGVHLGLSFRTASHAMMAAGRCRAAMGPDAGTDNQTIVRDRLKPLYCAMRSHAIADRRMFEYCATKRLPYLGRSWADPFAEVSS